jgi:uncharacterized protein YrzB (UPF0473 family)
MRDETDETDEPEIVTLTDDEGNDVDFLVVTLFDFEGATYAILAEAEQVAEQDPELDLYAFAYSEDEDGAELGPIEDDELLQAVFREAQRIIDGDDDVES